MRWTIILTGALIAVGSAGVATAIAAKDVREIGLMFSGQMLGFTALTAGVGAALALPAYYLAGKGMKVAKLA